MATSPFAQVSPTRGAPPAMAPPRAPNMNVGQGGGVSGAGFGTVGQAGRQAAYAMKTMGIPRLADLMGMGGSGSIEYGNAGAARDAMGVAQGELGSARDFLTKSRAAYDNPTGTDAFKNTMALAGEQTGRAADEAARTAREGAARRGFVGGADVAGAHASSDRMQALAEAGFGGVKDVREQALGEMGTAAGVYGSTLGAYKDLATAYAELPTKYLSAYASLMSGLQPGDFFKSAMQGLAADQATRRQNMAGGNGGMRATTDSSTTLQRPQFGGASPAPIYTPAAPTPWASAPAGPGRLR